MPQPEGMLGLGLRQVQRLCAAYRDRGAAGLMSAKRGRESNRRLPDELRRRAMELIRARYADFGPTLAAEKLAELHALTVSRETLRKWMVEAGVWVPRKQRRRVQQPRRRRPCRGELVQIDGSDHAWFEERGPKCTLLVFIDDATSELMELRFVESESTFAYFEALRSYLERHGKPVALYSDKASVFKPTGRQAKGVSQFGRALSELNIDILCANTPAAKGRVERSNSTLQDRLVKEMRLRGISTLGLSATTSTRLTAQWEAELTAWKGRDLSERDYVYVWADGIHFNIRLEDDRVCLLGRAAVSMAAARR